MEANPELTNGLVLIHNGGVGRHYSTLTVSDDERIIYFKLQIAVQFQYLWAVSLPRLSILGLYLRVFALKTKYLRAVYLTMAIVVLNLIILTMVCLLFCRPFAGYWDTGLPGQCGDIVALYRWISIPKIVVDIVILALPLPVIWQIPNGLSQKIGFTITFFTGSL